MSHILFNNEVRMLMKMGLTRDLAILTASAKLEDLTLFYSQVEKLREENEIIENELVKAGFISTNTITNDNEIKETEPGVHGGDKE